MSARKPTPTVASRMSVCVNGVMLTGEKGAAGWRWTCEGFPDIPRRYDGVTDAEPVVSEFFTRALLKFATLPGEQPVTPTIAAWPSARTAAARPNTRTGRRATSGNTTAGSGTTSAGTAASIGDAPSTPHATTNQGEQPWKNAC